MAKDEEKEQAQAVAEQEIKKAMENIFQRPITPQEFYYLLTRYPYLHLCDIDKPYIDEGTVPTVVTAKNGWKIHDYGSVLRSSNYELLLGLDEDEDEGGHGTIVQQYADVAFEMMALAKEKGWVAAEVLAGFYPMQRIAWIAATEMGYGLKGFDASPEDGVVRDWVLKMRKGELYPPKKPIISPRKAPGR